MTDSPDLILARARATVKLAEAETVLMAPFIFADKTITEALMAKDFCESFLRESVEEPA